ncbi:MAG: J domain-containing protein [Clostridia bacterium]|nr:J domain-containing protein [Clostridia bacterium]
MKDPYQVLGIPPTATDEEVKEAYRNLARKYHPDNYNADNPLADLATEKMQEINEAYDAIKNERINAKMRAETSGQNAGSGATGHTGGDPNDPHYAAYCEARRYLNSRRVSAADGILSRIPENERSAEWHFLKSVVLMHRGWMNDAMRELETACGMDPDNQEYQQAKEMFNRSASGYGSTYYNEGAYRRESAGCCDADFCTTLCLANLLCNLCGGCR